MLKRVKIISPGDTGFLEGDLVRRHELAEANAGLKDKIIITGLSEDGANEFGMGDVVDFREVYFLHSGVEQQDRSGIEVREARPAIGEPVVLGITEAALETNSWISAASFQQSISELTEAAARAETDPLRGFSENVAVGQKIPLEKSRGG